MNAVDQETGLVMTQILLPWSVTIARMFTSVAGATCLLVRSEKSQINKVATIGGKGHQPSGIGTVKWIWRDDSVKSHEYLVEDVLFFHNLQSTF